MSTAARASGHCLCGAVAYEVRGPLRDVVYCHCRECSRWTGHVGAFAATRAEHLVMVEERGLRWVESPDSERRALRGFCGECGSGLFWRPADGTTVSIAAGTIDRPTRLRAAGHIYAAHAADYDALPDDGLPRGAAVDTAVPAT
jgi:hypothetical protein